MNNTPFQTDQRYLTRGIHVNVPLEIQIVLWRMIDERLKQVSTMDTFQIFKFNIERNQLIIRHIQEQPEHTNTHRLINKQSFKALDGKTIYIIDDTTHATMLFAEEY